MIDCFSDDDHDCGQPKTTSFRLVCTSTTTTTCDDDDKQNKNLFLVAPVSSVSVTPKGQVLDGMNDSRHECRSQKSCRVTHKKFMMKLGVLFVPLSKIRTNFQFP